MKATEAFQAATANQVVEVDLKPHTDLIDAIIQHYVDAGATSAAINLILSQPVLKAVHRHYTDNGFKVIAQQQAQHLSMHPEAYYAQPRAFNQMHANPFNVPREVYNPVITLLLNWDLSPQTRDPNWRNALTPIYTEQQPE